MGKGVVKQMTWAREHKSLRILSWSVLRRTSYRFCTFASTRSLIVSQCYSYCSAFIVLEVVHFFKVAKYILLTFVGEV